MGNGKCFILKESKRSTGKSSCTWSWAIGSQRTQAEPCPGCLRLWFSARWNQLLISTGTGRRLLWVCPKGHRKFLAELRISPAPQTSHVTICPCVLSDFPVSFPEAISPQLYSPALLGGRRWHFPSPSHALSAPSATWDVLSLPWKQNHESFSQEMPPNCLHFVFLFFLDKSAACACWGCRTSAGI